MNITELIHDLGIPTAPEGHHHRRHGWRKREIWKPIPGYPHHDVSNRGRLRTSAYTVTQKSRHGNFYERRIPTMIRKLGRANGYPAISFNNGVIYVHRAMWAAFRYRGVIPKHLHINHKNGKKTDLRFSNLELITQKQNNEHAYRTGLKIAPHGETHYLAKLTEKDVRKIRRLIAKNVLSLRAIGRMFNVAHGAIRSIRDKRTWRRLK